MDHELTYHLATDQDLLDIVLLLMDDSLGAQREKLMPVLSDAYIKAFDRIKRDANQELTIVKLDGRTIGTFHLSFIQYLTHLGALRGQIEAVRVSSQFRGRGIGTEMFKYIAKRCENMGCYIIQLTTDKHREDAVKFYEALGYQPTHEGMKLKIDGNINSN